jgi:hypothetical protein
MDQAPDFALFVSDPVTFKTPTKNDFFLYVFLPFLFDGTFTSFFKDKIQRKSQ